MKNWIRKNWKKHLIVLGVMSAITFIVFSPYIFGLRPFIFSADQQLQYNYFYEEWARMINDFISNHVFPFYSFETFLGSNFYASKLYYVTGDVFLPLILAIGDVEIGLLIETILLVIFSGYNFSVFLRNFGLKREKVILSISILYAFSGLGSMYVGQYMFHRFYCFLPLLIAALEWYRRSHQLAPFAIMTCVLFLSSYYFMFPTCLFLVIYYFFTKVYHGDRFHFWSILCSALPLIGSFIVGFLLSGILMIPGILYVLGNQRIGEAGSIFPFFDIQVYLGFFVSYITAPFNLYSSIPYAFTSGSNGHLTWYSIYASALCAPAIFGLFKKKHDGKELPLFIMTVILLVFTLVSPLNSIFHGFSEPSFRWMFILVFFNLLVLAITLTHFEQRKQDLLDGGKKYLVVFFSCLILSLLMGIIDLEIYWMHALVMLLSVALLILYLFFVRKGKLEVLLTLICVECVSMCAVHLGILNKDYYSYTDTLNPNYIHYNDSMDEDLFYRMYVNPNELWPSSEMNLNQSIHIGYKGVATYDSTYEQSQNEFLHLNGINWHIIDLNNPEVLRMLGVKYYYVSDESTLPSNFNWTYYTNVNHLMVYKNEDYRPIGFTYSTLRPSVQTETDAEGIVIQNDLHWNDELLVDDSLYNQFIDVPQDASVNFELLEFNNDNNLYGVISNPTKQVLFFSIPYNEGWKIYDNGSLTSTYNVQGGFIGIVLEPGDHEIALQFTPTGFKQGAYATLAGMLLYIGLIVYDKKYAVKKYRKSMIEVEEKNRGEKR